MKTDIYTIDSKDSAANAVYHIAKAAQDEGINDAAVQRLQGLATSMVAVMNGMSQVSDAKLWLETGGGDAVVHAKAETVVDLTEEDRLKDMATNDKNTLRDTFGKKIAGFFQEAIIGQNEELHDYGYVPDLAANTFDNEYPIYWNLAAYDTESPYERHWNAQAAETVECLADDVEIGYKSDLAEIAAHVKYS